MLADFYIPQIYMLSTDMKFTVQKNHLVGQILYRIPNPGKNGVFFPLRHTLFLLLILTVVRFFRMLGRVFPALLPFSFSTLVKPPAKLRMVTRFSLFFFNNLKKNTKLKKIIKNI